MTESYDFGNRRQEIREWKYQNYFREYILLVARKGRIALERIDLFPEEIELNDSWHETLEEIRKSTKDGKERLAIVGVNNQRTSLMLPSISVMGEERYVSSESIRKEIERAEKFGVAEIVGDVHSHTFPLEGILEGSFVQDSLGLRALFSVSDYYRLIDPARFITFMGVVQGNYNLFAFKTRESTDGPKSTRFSGKEVFERYWYERFGYKYLGPREKYGDYRLIPTLDIRDLLNIQKEIVDQHKLVLYQGKAGQRINLIYPKLILKE